MISVKKSTKSNQASKLTDCKTSNLMEHETSYISPDLLIIQKLKEDECDTSPKKGFSVSVTDFPGRPTHP